MRTRAAPPAVLLLAALVAARLLHAALPKPAEWVPARWPFPEVSSLALLDKSPVNCLLVESPTAEFAAAAKARGVVVLAVSGPPDDLTLSAEGVPTVHLTTRAKMQLGGADPIIGTTQGVWPGLAPEENAHKAGPTSSVWIDTNSGFLRAVRVWGPATVWIANVPPANTVVTTTRYLQAIADAAIIGARWVVTFDADLAARLGRREEAALGTWNRMGALLGYFEAHPEWRTMREAGELAI